jgi:folate-dependent phosphoribosylglycinamide formyltransferase PurN
VINLHPVLLPLFGGRDIHGDKVHAALLGIEILTGTV